MAHGGRIQFFLDLEKARARPEMIHAGGGHGGKNKPVFVVDGDGLFGQINFDPAVAGYALVEQLCAGPRALY